MAAPIRSVVAVLFGLVAAPALRAETREFVVFVDGKPSGQFSFVIEPQKDGSLLVTNTAEVRIVLARITVYRYSFRGVELWKDGRLLRIDATTDDNGKVYQLQAALMDANRLRVRVNGQESVVQADVWTTSYWRLPADLDKRQGNVAMLDADTGRILQGKLAFVSKDQMRVAGQVIPCNRYRLTGAAQLDLWYDAQGIMVYQEGMEQGHKTALQLGNIAR